jgi:hypothetical protein
VFVFASVMSQLLAGQSRRGCVSNARLECVDSVAASPPVRWRVNGLACLAAVPGRRMGSWRGEH